MKNIYLLLTEILHKKFRVNGQYLIKGGFWLTLGHGLQIFSGLVLTIAFANLLDKQAYGLYQYVMAMAAVLGALTLSGMAVSVKRAVATGNDGALRYGFRVKLLWSITIVIASGCVSAYYFFAGNDVLGRAFLIVGIFAPFIESFSIYKSYLTGSRRFKESALLGFWRKPMVIVAVLVTLLLTDDPLIILFVYFISNTVSVGLLYRLVIKKYNLPYTKDPSALNYGKHLSVMGIAGTIGGNADKIAIFTLLGAQEVAIYSFAILPAMHLLKFFGFMGNDLIFPKFAKQSFGVIEKNILRKIFLFFLTTLIIVVIYIFIAKPIYSLLFPNYPEAVILSQIAILALLTKSCTLFGLVFSAHGFKKIQYFLIVSTNALKVVLLLLLIPIYGLEGAIWTFVLAHIYWSIAVACLFYYHKEKMKVVTPNISEKV